MDDTANVFSLADVSIHNFMHKLHSHTSGNGLMHYFLSLFYHIYHAEHNGLLMSYKSKPAERKPAVVPLLFTYLRDILNYVEVIEVEHQNITLSIPKEILKKVKHIAVEKNTSVSGLLSRHLEDIVARDDKYKKAKANQMEIMEKGFDLIGEGKASWNREELHDPR